MKSYASRCIDDFSSGPKSPLINDALVELKLIDNNVRTGPYLVSLIKDRLAHRLQPPSGLSSHAMREYVVYTASLCLVICSLL